MSFAHRPVFLREALEGLALRPGGVVLDATVGLGGHAEAIARQIGPSGLLVAVDRDKQALEMARSRLEKGDSRVKVIWVHGHFGRLDEILNQAGVEALDAALFDLGVSSMQLEDAIRGFSFLREGPLDMRMDPTEPATAAELVNRASQPELTEILRSYGEERWAGRIARAIVRARPLATTAQLAEVVRWAVPAGARHKKIDPSTRTFQAIRIAVNQELDLLPLGLRQAIQRLKANGRIAVLAYHSLEDRIVKFTFREEGKSGVLEVLTRKPLRPSEEEVVENPRSRSACLRIARRR